MDRGTLKVKLLELTTLTAVLLSSFVISNAKASPILKPTKPVVLPGTSGRFDFMATDFKRLRILGAHKGAKSLVVLNLKDHKSTEIPVGQDQGVAIDPAHPRYFVGDEDEHQVVIIDASTLKVLKSIPVSGPVDAIAYDSHNEKLYAAEDDGDKIWVIDTRSAKVENEISIPGAPEVLEYDPGSDKIFLNIKSKDEMVRIDPGTNRVEATWSTLPAKGPHGLAVDSERQLAISAGHNGELVALSTKTGKLISSAKIAPGVDQIVFDKEKDLIFSACKENISVTSVTSSGLKRLGDVPTPKGAHTLALDPDTHGVWVSYGDEKSSTLELFHP